MACDICTGVVERTVEGVSTGSGNVSLEVQTILAVRNRPKARLSACDEYQKAKFVDNIPAMKRAEGVLAKHPISFVCDQFSTGNEALVKWKGRSYRDISWVNVAVLQRFVSSKWRAFQVHSLNVRVTVLFFFCIFAGFGVMCGSVSFAEHKNKYDILLRVRYVTRCSQNNDWNRAIFRATRFSGLARFGVCEEWCQVRNSLREILIFKLTLCVCSRSTLLRTRKWMVIE